MQIILNLQIFIFIIVFLFTKKIKMYAVLMCFAVIHEIFHMLMGILLGYKPKTLRIMPFGFEITFQDNELNYSNIKKILIAFAGPFINIIIAIIGVFLHNEMLTFTNLIIALFNLIPIYPLDGGRILNEFLKLKINNMEADRITNRVSKILVIIMTVASSFLIIYMKNFIIIFVLIYLWYIVLIENKRYKIKKRVYEIIEK